MENSDLSESGRKKRVDALLLGLILLFLLAMMLRNVDAPLLDRHAWRQVDTASFARGLARGDFDVFHPTFLAYYPDAYGIEGAVETEFNFYPLVVAALYKVFGVHELLARLVSIACALGTAVWVYLLGRRYLDRPAGFLAALFLGLSPLYLFYSRTVQPEAMVLFLSLGALYFFTSWLESEHWAPYIAAILFAATAFLTKIPSLYMGLPLLGAAWMRYRRHLFRDWRIWLFGAATLLPMVAYYLHAHSLYQESGLTVYGISGGWPGSGKFDTWGQLLSTGFYRVMLVRFRGIILGRYGFLLMLLGLAIVPRKKGQWVLYVWLAAVALFVLGVAQGNRQHEYYQLPVVPVAALFVGKALSVILRPDTLRLEIFVFRRYVGSLLVILLLAVSLRNALPLLRPMYAQTKGLLDVAAATRQFTPKGEPIAVLYDWARVPEVFYYADRRGWALWLERTPEGEYGRLIIAERERTPGGWKIQERLEEDIQRIELLRSQKASSLVVSLEKGTAQEFMRSTIGESLSSRYPLVASAEHWLIYDLMPPANSQ